MTKHWKYLSYVLRHKWYVFVECLRLGIPWRGLVHDLSKLFPSEWFPYANYFYGSEDQSLYSDAFDLAWLLHQKRNKHHWQWWMLPEDNGGCKILQMPTKYAKEMAADWRGANRAQGGNGTTDSIKWYHNNKHKMQLHIGTRLEIESLLGIEDDALHPC